VFGCTDNDPAPGVSVTHGWFADAVQVAVVDTVMVCAGGFAPLNVSDDGLTVRAGPMFNVTPTVFGDPVAPGAVIVTVAV
jgi:hypothetical protein